MADRDKVICDLQILRTWCAVDPIYGIGLTPRECEMAVRWLDDALELLKEQEPVEYNSRKGVNGFTVVWTCGNCGADLQPNSRRARFCSKCGRAVKWE